MREIIKLLHVTVLRLVLRLHDSICHNGYTCHDNHDVRSNQTTTQINVYFITNRSDNRQQIANSYVQHDSKFNCLKELK